MLACALAVIALFAAAFAAAFAVGDVRRLTAP
jgi:hypothetical protein